MKIGVVGTGAVGGYFGACLGNTGHEVVFIARGDKLVKMKEKGLTVQGTEGEFTVSGAFTESYESLSDVDLILFCVKSTATKIVAEALVPIIKKDTLILTLQNGVDNEETLASLFGSVRVFSAASYIQAQMTEPGLVKQIGNSPRLVIGALDESQKEVAQQLTIMLQNAGIETYLSSNILKVKWRKLLWNVTFNPLSALIESKVGVILDNDDLKTIAIRICQEATKVARKAGIPVEEDIWVDIMEKSHVSRNHETSMLQDKRNGKQMELESICGYVVKKGKEVDVDTPVLETIYGLLKLEDNNLTLVHVK
ncbi:2-dehydropantoate 2-reductase [Mesobacillus maritimus]|uniref:ketopantoate reductase family protein n=1 Tax=Mesobacillus maritimus TaxID=1643336 RepID=UPI00204170CC|nr:2-dehydropantoate 2-reductase [Mesobacillus maritimus]MCM3586789.1 2-dehydropantoate 2-reductase [Mesobacillus maritimus]